MPEMRVDIGRPADGESARFVALRNYEILDTPHEEKFDDITRLVAHICETPVALISFLDEARQWFKSTCGIDLQETPIDQSICRHAIHHDGLLVIPDTRNDPRTSQNPLVVNDPNVRFYAGAVLRTDDGLALGTLCVIDIKPRTLREDQEEALQILARQVMTQLELRRTLAMQRTLITEMNRHQHDAQAARRSAESANAAKDRFLAFLSHELRTPLTPVLLTAGAIANDDRVPPEVRADARMITRNIDMQTRLVDDLLDVTRMASDKLELKSDFVDLHTLIAESVALCSAEAMRKNIRIDQQLLAKDYFIAGDPVRLQQVLCNLIKNSVKFTGEDGAITIATSDDVDGFVELRVADNGIGIESHLLPQVFEPFQQGSNSITRQYGGLGLGLAISKGIVVRHGGSIDAFSNGHGHGATFTVRLKTVPSPAPFSARPSEPTVDGAKTANILLVDDHEDTLRAMTRLLRSSRHQVTTATSVQTALQAADKTKFDVIISDLGLPDGTGLDLMRQLLGRQQIKGIAVTGYGMESDIDQTREAGFSTHLTKPVNAKELEAAVGRLMHSL